MVWCGVVVRVRVDVDVDVDVDVSVDVGVGVDVGVRMHARGRGRGWVSVCGRVRDDSLRFMMIACGSPAPLSSSPSPRFQAGWP